METLKNTVINYDCGHAIRAKNFYAERVFERFTDALIAAGIGDVKEAKRKFIFVLKNKLEYTIHLADVKEAEKKNWRRKKKMKIYLVNALDGVDWDRTKSFVVIAHDPYEVMSIAQKQWHGHLDDLLENYSIYEVGTYTGDQNVKPKVICEDVKWG